MPPKSLGKAEGGFDVSERAPRGQERMQEADNSVSTYNFPTWIQSREINVTYVDLYPAAEPAAGARLLVTQAVKFKLAACSDA